MLVFIPQAFWAQRFTGLGQGDVDGEESQRCAMIGAGQAGSAASLEIMAEVKRPRGNNPKPKRRESDQARGRQT